MKADQERNDPGSCINKALPDEMTFVLLGRDMTFARVVRYWCGERVRQGLNKWEDPQIKEALAAADAAQADHGRIRAILADQRKGQTNG